MPYYKKKIALDGFEKRELLGNRYWQDPRWKLVRKLREQKENAKANGLVIEIRESYNLN